MNKSIKTCPKCSATMELNPSGVTLGSSPAASGMIIDSSGSTSPEYVGGTWVCEQCGYFETDSEELDFFS